MGLSTEQQSSQKSLNLNKQSFQDKSHLSWCHGDYEELKRTFVSV